MHVQQLSINGNPNVGLNIFCNNKFALVGKHASEEQVNIIKEVLKVPVHQITIAGTDLIGVFVVGTEEKIIVPSIIFDEELEEIKALGINVEKIEVDLTALGNNILCKDNKALVNPEYKDEEVEIIKQALNLSEIKKFAVHELGIIGGLVAYNSKGAAVYRDINQQTKEELQEFLELPCEESTVNMGSPFISSGVVCNDNGFLIGDMSGGPEMYNMELILGFSGGSDNE